MEERIQSSIPDFVAITIGHVIAALAFTISIQQFLKPIHRFRLKVWGIALNWIFIAVFSGAALVFFGSFLRYAAFEWTTSSWLVPSLEIVGEFGQEALIDLNIWPLTPAKLTKRNSPRFSRAAFDLLSKAGDDDYVSLFKDITYNIIPLSRLAGFNDNYRFAGLELDEPSAFYDFIHRKKLEQSSYASTLFQLLSDPYCCRAIVRRDPISVVSMLSDLSHHGIHCKAVAQLVQEFARHSVIQDDSMLAREVDYKGFASVSLFLNAMFGDHFIIRNYLPFSALVYFKNTPITYDLAERLGRAIELAWEKTPELWHPQSLWNIQSAIESVLFSIRYADSRKKRHEQEHIRLYNTVARIIDLTDDHIRTQSRRLDMPYAETENPEFRKTMPGVAAEIAVGALNSIANDFDGFEDRRWTEALDIMGALFPSVGEEPDGLTPTQQHAAIIIRAKLADNMNGYYPALTRLLLAVIGPYGSHTQNNKTAFRILEDIAYEQWQKLPQLHDASPERISDFLPPNVKFDRADLTLTHTYRGGETRVTVLSNLSLLPIDLLNPSLRRADLTSPDSD